MFLGANFTRFALNPTTVKHDPRSLEDARCSLIGNSFHAGVVALLLAPLFCNEGLLDSRPTLRTSCTGWAFALERCT